MKPCSGLLFLSTIFVFVIVNSTPSQGIIQSKNERVVACYVASWAYYRKNDGKFDTENLKPELCTHLIYAFAGLNATSWTIRSLDPWRDVENGIGNYKKMTQLKKSYPHLKFSLGIGGWTEGSKNYSDLASSPGNRKTFIASVVHFLRKYQFDGFDLDWEFPGARGGAPYDKENFVALVKELKDAFRGHDYSLTAAISANKQTIDAAYDITEITKYLDHIYVMAYDYHGAWDMQVLPNSPLNSEDELNVKDSIEHLIKKGAPASKLVLGLAMYGRTFILANKPNSTSEKFNPIGQRSIEKGFKGQFTGQEGFMGYNEICLEFVNRESNWIRGWDKASSTPYAFKDDHVIVYDDPISIKAKVEFVKELNLAGVMVWSIDTDDFLGQCASLPDSTKMNYPLMRSINAVFDTKISGTPKPNSSSSAETLCYSYAIIIFFTISFVKYL